MDQFIIFLFIRANLQDSVTDIFRIFRDSYFTHSIYLSGSLSWTERHEIDIFMFNTAVPLTDN